MINRRQKQEPEFHQVQTTADPRALTIDSNKDGIPDYLQRQDIPSMVKTNQDLNQWETDVKKEIEEWVMGLDGREYNPDSHSYVATSPPIINSIGIQKIKNHLLAVVNKHAINTGLKVEEMHMIAQSQSVKLINWLKYNARKCKISFSDLDPIVTQFDNFITLVLSRAVEDGQRKHVTQRTRLTGVVGSQQGNFPG